MMITRSLIPVFLLAACNVGAAIVTPTPTPSSGVDIISPQDGSVIYAEQMYLSGTASGVDSFTLQLLGPDGTILARDTIRVSGGEWQKELAHGYTGEPIEVTIVAAPEHAPLPLETAYDIAIVALAGLSYRPDGAFGSITSPTPNSNVGGDSFEATGMVSGVFENTFTLSLIGADGSVIDSEPITVFDPYFVDEVPWTAELATNGYSGAGEIRAFYNAPSDGSEVVLASIPVTVIQEAG